MSNKTNDTERLEVRESEQVLTTGKDSILHEGDCSALPLNVVAGMMINPLLSSIFVHFHEYCKGGRHVDSLYQALYSFIGLKGWTVYRALLEISSFYAKQTKLATEGDKCPDYYIDQSIRHLLKYNMFMNHEFDASENETNTDDLACMYNIMEAIRVHIESKEPNIRAEGYEDTSEENIADEKSDVVTVPRAQLESMINMIGGVYDAMNIPVPESPSK